jgi:hypothetical protein
MQLWLFPVHLKFIDTVAESCNVSTAMLTSGSPLHTSRTYIHRKKGGAHNGQNLALRPAPSPSLVFLMTAVSGASRPPENPIVAPSDQPIDVNIMNPTLVSSIFGAVWEKV